MIPQHHPAEEFLLQYASGASTEPFALLIAAHLVYCAECRAAVAQAEAIGGALLDELEQEAVPAASLDDVAKIIERAARQPQIRLNEPGSRIAAPLRNYVSDFASVSWRPLGPGIQHCLLVRDKQGAAARLLRIAPGRSVFEHSHAGTEMTMALEGGYRASGEHFRCGDVECADETKTHRPVADGDAICICLAVTDAPLRFHNLLGRMMQPFIRI
jgi:putative transcriptional regulator